MKRTVLLFLALILCSSCALSNRLIVANVQDATDALHNAELSGDPAAVQCFASKLAVSERAAQLKVSGGLSAVAAKRALRKWNEQVQLDCAEVIVDGLAWVRRFVPGGL